MFPSVTSSTTCNTNKWSINKEKPYKITTINSNSNSNKPKSPKTWTYLPNNTKLTILYLHLIITQTNYHYLTTQTTNLITSTQTINSNPNLKCQHINSITNSKMKRTKLIIHFRQGHRYFRWTILISRMCLLWVWSNSTMVLAKDIILINRYLSIKLLIQVKMY